MRNEPPAIGLRMQRIPASRDDPRLFLYTWPINIRTVKTCVTIRALGLQLIHEKPYEAFTDMIWSVAALFGEIILQYPGGREASHSDLTGVEAMQVVERLIDEVESALFDGHIEFIHNEATRGFAGDEYREQQAARNNHKGA